VDAPSPRYTRRASISEFRLTNFREGIGMLVIPTRVKVVVVMVSALALAGGLLTLALLSKPAQAQAETTTTQDRSTFNVLFDSCTGESVNMQGTSHTVAHSTIDENGVVHSTLHFNTRGKGESDSGAKYVFHDASTQHLTFTGDLEDVTLTMTSKLIRQGSATPTDDLDFRYLLHVTINDRGDVTAAFEKEELECK
jgi:hypothetical protein